MTFSLRKMPSSTCGKMTVECASSPSSNGSWAHGQRCLWVGGSADGQRHEHLVAVQAWIPIAQIVALERLNGLDHGGRNQLIFFLDPAQHLERVENQRRRGPKQVGGFSGDDAPVRQLNGQGGSRPFPPRAYGLRRLRDDPPVPGPLFARSSSAGPPPPARCAPGPARNARRNTGE